MKLKIVALSGKKMTLPKILHLISVQVSDPHWASQMGDKVGMLSVIKYREAIQTI